MAEREDLADKRFDELVDLIAGAFRAYEAEVRTLKVSLANADQTAQARVDEALAGDSEFDADKKERGNAALEALLNKKSEEGSADEPVADDDAPSIPQPEDDATQS